MRPNLVFRRHSEKFQYDLIQILPAGAKVGVPPIADLGIPQPLVHLADITPSPSGLKLWALVELFKSHLA